MLVSDPRYAEVGRMEKIRYAKEYAAEYYNTTRDMFIHMISVRYEKDEETYLFEAALNEYDLIQKELNDYFENVA